MLRLAIAGMVVAATEFKRGQLSMEIENIFQQVRNTCRADAMKSVLPATAKILARN